ncbi:MaoC family dehydratase [Rhodococcus chondri]|uniref:MaoC/PaaZ C-terminal domain-containing protein n=1 Tax=Rhodococcus chondri TaxID=3065941 RepID=A0ABU7JUN7_9NOCA|nr:MaoC/PaaZ C-terminal domain-containing protein [Rhodococcus sp. CC-R104]MEE2033733.1 MaoC/PaaZ C-terminal domain-containing protein [Rhodococcus sp. CC-R104]
MITSGIDIEPGFEFAPREFGPITMTDIVRYQGASGDLNPMHHDDEMARAAGYPAAFSVGMLGAGYLAAYCTELFGTRTVRQFRTRFRKVVYRGEVLTAHVVVREVRGSGNDACVELGLELTDSDGAVVVDGSAEFLLVAMKKLDTEQASA